MPMYSNRNVLSFGKPLYLPQAVWLSWGLNKLKPITFG